MNQSGPLFLTPDTPKSTSSLTLEPLPLEGGSVSRGQAQVPQTTPPSKVVKTSENDDLLSDTTTGHDLDPLLELGPDRTEAIDWLKQAGFDRKATNLEHCGTTFAHMECVNGHYTNRRIDCRLPFCETCGANGSRAHARSAVRTKDRLLFAPTLGYVVATLPDYLSNTQLPPDMLALIKKELARLVAKCFNAPGCYVRIHWTGKDPSHLSIHFNVLFPIVGTGGRGKVAQDRLDMFQSMYTTYINRLFKLDIGRCITYYEFRTTDTQKGHAIKYVTRSTFTSECMQKMSHEDKLYLMETTSLRNGSYYGILSNLKWKQYALDNGIDRHKYREKSPDDYRKCKACGELLRYVGVISRSDILPGVGRWLTPHTHVDLEQYACIKANAPPASAVDRAVISLSSQESSEKLQEKTKVEPERWW